MKSKTLEICALALAFCTTFAIAQTSAPQAPPSNSVQPAHPAPVAEPVPAAQAVPAAHAAEPAPAAPVPVAKADSVAAPVTKDTVPVAPSVPEAVAVAKPEIPQVAPAAPSEPLKFDFGLRVGVGISSFRGHKALAFTSYSIIPGIDYSYSIGLVSSIAINNFFSIAPELQYSFYSASNEYTIEEPFNDFDPMREAYVYMYAVELPIMFRFKLENFYNIYMEVGPQFGINNYAKIYKNNLPYKPDLNVFAFGPAAGFGVNMNGILLGIRGYFGITEYAENSNGYPWSVQASLTTFFF